MELTTECQLLSEILRELRVQRARVEELVGQVELLTLTSTSEAATILGQTFTIAFLPDPAVDGTPVLVAPADSALKIVRLFVPSTEPSIIVGIDKSTMQVGPGRGIIDVVAAGARVSYTVLPGTAVYARITSNGAAGSVGVNAVALNAVRWRNVLGAVHR